MIFIWHEGALGDLLLARLAIGFIRQNHNQKIILFARHEARLLFLEAGWVDEAFPTSLAKLDSFPSPEKVYLFARSRFLIEEFKSRFGSRFILLPSRPAPGEHAALGPLKILGAKHLPPLVFPFKRIPLDRLVILHPGSGGRYKCLNPEIFKELFFYLKENGFSPQLILGPAEEDLRPFFRDLAPSFCAQIQEVLPLLKRASYFIGHDSGLTHLASSLGLSIFAVFGPTDWRSWAPLGEKVGLFLVACKCLEKGIDPRSCQTPCLKRLSFEEIKIPLSLWLKDPEKFGLKGPYPGLRLYQRNPD